MEITLEHFGIPVLVTLQNQGTERAPGLMDGEEIRMEGKHPRFQLQKARGCAGYFSRGSLKNTCPLKQLLV